MRNKSFYKLPSNPLITVGICTYKRVETIPYVFDALKKQTYNNFEIVVVLKPSGDGTENVIEKYSKDFQIKIVLQQKGSVTNAYNLVIENATGDIIVILDDDASPAPTLLKEYVKTYQKYENVGGVSGPAESAIVEDGKVIPVPNNHGAHVRRYEFPWARPLKQLSNWLIYFGKDGLVHHRQLLKKGKVDAVYPSFLFMGANMSFKKEAVEGLAFDEQNFLGYTGEQCFSYKIWKRGYNLLFNPKAHVLHIVLEDTLGRFYNDPKKAALRDTEFLLTFPFVKRTSNVSFIAYILSIASILFAYMLKVRKYGLSVLKCRAYGLAYGFVVASSMMISKAIGGNFSKINALRHLR